MGFELSLFERDQVLTQIERDKQPFGILQDLIDDQSVTDIIISNFSKMAVQSSRKNILVQRAFASQETYEAFIERILTKAGSSYSTRKPIADGMIGSFARIHAVHKSISDGGPYLTIRLNRFSHVSLSDIYNTHMAPSVIVDYLRSLICAGKTVLVVGEVGTGKTTLTRALAATIPSHESILVIEDLSLIHI